MRLSTIGFTCIYLNFLFISGNGLAQEDSKSLEINGIVRSKTSSLSFENFGYEKIRFSGGIQSNLSGSKYNVHLDNGTDKIEGEITDKFSKFNISLKYRGGKIEGEIKRSTNHTKDEWEIGFLDHKLSGKVFHNALNTVDTYQLNYDNQKFTGKIHKQMNKLVYDLSFGKKKITGQMSYNASAVKHSYNLKGENLTEDEFVVFLFIESIKLMNEQINEIDEFQGNN